MATDEQVRALIEAGETVEAAARELTIPPGLAYMLATGRPADGSQSARPQERAGRPEPDPRAQRFVNPPAVNPTRQPRVIDWVARRAARDLTPGDG